MSDVTDNDYPPRARASRRLFLKGAGGVAAASVAAVLTPRSWVQAQTAQHDETGLDACCATTADTPLLAAARFQDRYVALAASASGAGLFALEVAGNRHVALGAALPLQLPAGFVVTSLGVVRGRLALSGGMPFLFDSYEVNDEMTEDVRAAMDVIPAEAPTSGTRLIEVMGVRPALLLLDLPSGLIESVELPPMPQRAYALATAVTETADGALLVMIEHSDRYHEAYYAAAVDLIEQSLSGQWVSRSIARELGESGPHYLAVNGTELAVALNTSAGARLLSPNLTGLSLADSTVVEGRLLSLQAGNAGFVALASSAAGVRRLSGVQPGVGMVDSGEVRLGADLIVGAVPVAGAWGQSILLGRHSARLLDEASGPAVRI